MNVIRVFYMIWIVYLSGIQLKTASPWDSYIDNLISLTKDASGTAHSDKACIIGLDDGVAWTTDGHPNALNLSTAESENIAKCFKSMDFYPFKANGILAEGIKYQFLMEEKVEEGKIVLAKAKSQGALTLQASNAAIVIAHTKEGCDQGNTDKAVSAIVKEFKSLGI